MRAWECLSNDKVTRVHQASGKRHVSMSTQRACMLLRMCHMQMVWCDTYVMPITTACCDDNARQPHAWARPLRHLGTSPLLPHAFARTTFPRPR